MGKKPKAAAGHGAHAGQHPTGVAAKSTAKAAGKPVPVAVAKPAPKSSHGGGAKTAAMLSVVTASGFTPVAAGSISKNEIYDRLEWFFHVSHAPGTPHQINPAAPIGALFANLQPPTLHQVLFVNINKASQTFVPAWKSPLFHGIDIPWVSKKPIALGIRDVKTFGDLLTSVAKSYSHAGWNVV